MIPALAILAAAVFAAIAADMRRMQRKTREHRDELRRRRILRDAARRHDLAYWELRARAWRTFPRPRP